MILEQNAFDCETLLKSFDPIHFITNTDITDLTERVKRPISEAVFSKSMNKWFLRFHPLFLIVFSPRWFGVIFYEGWVDDAIRTFTHQ